MRNESEVFLEFEVADLDPSGKPVGYRFEARDDFDGVLVGYSTHEPDDVGRLCPPKVVSELVGEIRHAVQVLDLRPRRLMVELTESGLFGGGDEGRSWTSRDQQVLLEFETGGTNDGSDWVSRASQIAWHELMHAKNVLDGLWPAHHFYSFGREPKPITVIAALGHLWIDGYLNQQRLPDLRTKRDAGRDVFRTIADGKTLEKIDERVADAIEQAGGSLAPSAAFSIEREAIQELAPAELRLADSVMKAWWGREMDCWQNIALAASMGFTLPMDCAFAEWMRTQRPASYRVSRRAASPAAKCPHHGDGTLDPGCTQGAGHRSFSRPPNTGRRLKPPDSRRP